MDKIIKTKGTWKRWPVALQVTRQVQKNSFISDVSGKWKGREKIQKLEYLENEAFYIGQKL